GSRAPALFVGALVNAHAVAAAVAHLLNRAGSLNVTVLACGERWRTPAEEGVRRTLADAGRRGRAALCHGRLSRRGSGPLSAAVPLDEGGAGVRDGIRGDAGSARRGAVGVREWTRVARQGAGRGCTLRRAAQPLRYRPHSAR